MVENDEPTGGFDEGKYDVNSLSLHEIYEAAQADHDNLSQTETRKEGWRLMHEFIYDVHHDLKGKLPGLKESFNSKGGKVYHSQLDNLSEQIKVQGDAAKQNKEATENTIAEVKRVWPKVKELKEHDDLAESHRQSLSAQNNPETGENEYVQAKKDTLDEARSEFGTSNSTYADTNGMTIEPYEFEGPRWDGRNPKRPLSHYQHAYYPPEIQSGGAGVGASGGGHHSLNSAASNASGSSTPTHHSPASDHPSPDLQGPSGTPAPTPTHSSGPTPTPGGTPSPGNSGFPGPGFGGVRPVAPPAGGGLRPGGLPNGEPGPNGARPTPGMNRPIGGRPGGAVGEEPPMGGRGGMGKNSLLPNQRQAAAGRNPLTGSGKGTTPARSGRGGAASEEPTGKGRGGRGSRGGMPEEPTSSGRGGRGAASEEPLGGGRSARGGAARGRPNAGFEEDMYSGTRAGRTVPGVVRGARSGVGEAAEGSGRGVSASRISRAGRVFGERANKGVVRNEPEFEAGSLTRRGVVTSVSRKDSSFSWSRVRPRQSTEPPSGSVKLGRRESSVPVDPNEERRRKWAKRRAWRKAFCEGRSKRDRRPETELYDGVEGRVVPDVIRGTAYPERTDRRDAGARFSTYGWEDEA